MSRQSHDEFFTGLAELLASRKGKDHGMVYLVQKRLSYGQEAPSSDATNSPLGDLQPAPILIRATDGKGGEKRKERVKLSTVVEPAALEGFYARYAEVCKAGMTALKPRDKSRKKAKAKKRRGGAAGS